MAPNTGKQLLEKKKKRKWGEIPLLDINSVWALGQGGMLLAHWLSPAGSAQMLSSLTLT